MTEPNNVDYVLSRESEQRWFPGSKECANCGEAIDLGRKFGGWEWVHCRSGLHWCGLPNPVATPKPNTQVGSQLASGAIGHDGQHENCWACGTDNASQESREESPR